MSERLTERQLLKLRRAAQDDLYLAMAIGEIDTLLKERDEARKLAAEWRTSSEEAGAYSEEAGFPWEVASE